MDPNRNFGYKWGGLGASTNPCSETYRGPYSFSEAETRAVRDYLTPMASRVKLYLTYHSYGQYVLYPWGYDNKSNAPNWQNLQSVGDVAGKAMQAKSRHRSEPWITAIWTMDQ